MLNDLDRQSIVGRQDEALHGYLNDSISMSSKSGKLHRATAFSTLMPGVMSLKEVKSRIDLDQWKAKVGDLLVHLSVSSMHFLRITW